MKEEILTSPNYSHFLFRVRVPLVNVNLQFSLQWFPVHQKALGITNRTSAGKYFVMLDYDDADDTEISDECAFLQTRFDLGPFYVFNLDREKSHHAICPTLLTANECFEVIKASSADEAFKNAPKYFGRSRWILRIGNKGQRNPPVFAFTMPRFTQRSESKGLKDFLHAYYSVPTVANGNDFNDVIQFVEYETSNRLK